MRILYILALGCAGSAWAQTTEIWFSGGQSLLTNSGLGTTQLAGGSKNDVQLTDGFRFGFRLGLNTLSRFGQEIQYGYNRTHLRFNSSGGTEQGMAIHQGGYNFLVYGSREGFRVRPFVTGGVHFSNFVPPGSSIASGGGSTKVGVNYGAGIKVRVASIFAVRFDVRQYVTGKPFDLFLKDGVLRQTEISTGFGVVF